LSCKRNYQKFTSQHISKTFCNGYSRTIPGFPLFKKQHSKPTRSLQHLAYFLHLCDVLFRRPHIRHNNEHKYITNRQTVWPLDYILWERRTNIGSDATYAN
jgi:transposase